MEPRAPIEPEGLFDGLRAGPILLGALIDHVATLAATGLLIVTLAPELATGPASQEALDELAGSSAFLLGTLLCGALCTVLGAYAGARVAGQHHVSHGGWVAVTSTLFSLIYLIPSSDPAAANQPEMTLPLWAEAIAWLAILPSGIAGGLLARRTAGGED